MVNFMPQPLNSGGKSPPPLLSTYGIGGWMGAGEDLDALKKKSPSITSDRTTIFQLSNLLPGHFIDDAVAVQILEN